MKSFIVIVNIALNLIAGSFAGSPVYETQYPSRPSCDYLELYLHDYPLREIVLYYTDIRNFVNNHSVSHDVQTGINEYTADVLSSQIISAEDKNDFYNYVISYVRTSLDNIGEPKCFDGVMKLLIPGWTPNFTIPSPLPPS